MNILIGSRALDYHGRLEGRKPADWDIITDQKGYVSKQGVEIEYYLNNESTETIFHKCKNYILPEIMTPFGVARIAPLSILKVLKLASVNHLDKAKHTWDLIQLQDVNLANSEKRLAALRSEEIRIRVENQKDQFFNKYVVPRFYDHDLIHKHINPVPIYTKILKSPVDVCEIKFNKLTKAERRMLIREENLVLALERDLIPKIKEKPFLINLLIEDFLRTETSNTSALRWLSRLSIESKVKDHPIWCTKWTKENINYILDGYNKWWHDRVHGMPQSFWESILSAN